ncbi:hypothetical protein K6Y31_15460 [Motilimonas cestriensis]|uniref:Uncharacterized protein n=1 Tax=Motilimonas cestriensis TaxID=2742685 RepID=A0ABS8WEP4_9GAMM|nr:hypothetical protein [Motilimonas cestriensis]MCE2596211.1 hypothetical protein [Motilimonas cestriensis]
MIFYFAIFALLSVTFALLYKQRRADVRLVKKLINSQTFYLNNSPIVGDNLSLVSVIRSTPKQKVGLETHFTIYCFDKEEQKPLCVTLELVHNKLKRAEIRQSKGLQLQNVMDNLVLD